MTDQPSIEWEFIVHAPDSATIRKGDFDYQISGPVARGIIDTYQHCYGHPTTGPIDAQLYLWGVIDGMRQQVFKHAEDAMYRMEQRRAEIERGTGGTPIPPA